MHLAHHGEDAPGEKRNKERKKKRENGFPFALTIFDFKKLPKTFFFPPQIRAQMAAAGFPLLGDVLYGTADYSRVEAPRKREADREAEEEEDGKEGTESEENPPPPPLPLDRPIALHATRLASSGRHALDVFGMDPAVFDAGAPWWRSGLGVEDERDLERALELRAEVEEAASAGARGGEESGNDDEGEEEETSALVA